MKQPLFYETECVVVFVVVNCQSVFFLCGKWSFWNVSCHFADSPSVKNSVVGESPVPRERFNKLTEPKERNFLENKKSSSYRSVSSFKFTPTSSEPRRTGVSSAPGWVGPQGRTPSSLTRSTPVSRFARSELSSSVRSYRPSYKAPDHVINRTESLKLSRPKDFIQPKATPECVRQVHHARTIAPDRVALESVTSKKLDDDHDRVDEPESQGPAVRDLGSSPELKRSESCKENERSKRLTGVIPVVPGNKRRSLGILGRVLSVKIGSEKPSSPFRSNATASKPAVDSSPKPEIKPVPEENQRQRESFESTKQTDSKEENESKADVVFETTTEQPQASVEVTCSFTEVDGFEIEKSFADLPTGDDQSPEEVNSEIRSVVEILVNQIAGESVEYEAAPSETSSNHSLTDPTEQIDSESSGDLISEPEPLINQERAVSDLQKEVCDEVAPSVDSKTEEAKDIVSEEYLEGEVKAVEDEQSSVEQDELSAASEHAAEAPGPEEKTPTSAAPASSEEQEESDHEEEENVRENVAPEDAVDKEAAASETVTIKESVAELQETQLRERLSSASSDSNSYVLSDSSDFSGAELDDDMDARVAIRSRYGESGGSVKSRIIATEMKTPETDVAKLRKTRQAVDARVFRNSEGVKSRMNKFASSQEGAKTVSNGAPRTEVRTKTHKSAPGSSVVLNGSARIADKKEVNNNTPKSPSLSTKFKGTSPVESKDSPLDRLEAASMSTIDDMKALTRDTPARRSRRARLESSECKVTTTHDGITTKSATFELKFEAVETVVTQRAPVAVTSVKPRSPRGASESSSVPSSRSSPSVVESQRDFSPRDEELARRGDDVTSPSASVDADNVVSRTVKLTINCDYKWRVSVVRVAMPTN